jgi:hypothetical protein
MTTQSRNDALTILPPSISGYPSRVRCLALLLSKVLQTKRLATNLDNLRLLNQSKRIIALITAVA